MNFLFKLEVEILSLTRPVKDLSLIKKISDHLKETNLRNYMLFRFHFYTALRTQDVLRLKVKDVRGKYQIAYEYEITVQEKKTKKTKFLNINPELQRDIEEYTENMNDDDYLFPSQKRNPDGSQRPLTREQAFRILKKAGEEVGVKISGHALRKTACYHMYKKGIPIAVISQMLNHSSERVTRRYIGLEQEDIKQAYYSLSLDEL